MTKLNEDIKSNLNELLKSYYDITSQIKALENTKKTLNNSIKTIMATNKLNTYTSEDGYKSIYSVSKQCKFKDELVDFVKTTNIPNITKTVEVVDMDVLEDALYHKLIEPKDIEPYRVITEIPKLTVNKPKKLLQE